MEITAFFGLLGGLLVLAFIANRAFRRTRVPDVIVLMAVGLLVGPGLGWVDAAQYQDVAHAFGTLAIILILFEGGLELQLRETMRHFPGGLALSVISFLLSMGLAAVVVWWALRLPWSSALLIGAVLGCTSSSIVLPVLQQMELSKPLKVPLILEASLGDVYAVLVVKILLDLEATGQSLVRSVLGGFAWKMTISIGIAMVGAFLWSRLLPKLSEQRFWSVLTFAFVLLMFASAEVAGASGLIAVLAFGLALANLPGIDRRVVDVAIDLDVPHETPVPEHHIQVLAFHSELAFLVRTFFFVLLGAVVNFGGMQSYLPAIIGIFGALFVARWIAVLSTKWAWRGFEPRERELLLWMMPRGLITAVLAIQVLERRGEEFAFLPTLAFAVIMVTNFIVVLGSIRARRRSAADADALSLTGAPREQSGDDLAH